MSDQASEDELNAVRAIAEGMHEAAAARIEAHKWWVPLTVRDAGGLAEDLWINGVSYENIQKVIELQRAAGQHERKG